MGNYKTLILLFLLIWQSSTVASQEEEEKSNPVLFAEIYAGGAGGEGSGILLGTGFNYQHRKNLFGFRYTGTSNIGYTNMGLALIAFPFPVLKSTLDEFALLYGRRFIREGHSLSLSLGPAYNTYTFYGNREQEQISFAGVTLEANIRWFKKEKKRFRIYRIVPVGKPTAFGYSYGFKLSGNISETWYTGLSFVMAWGWHKKY